MSQAGANSTTGGGGSTGLETLTGNSGGAVSGDVDHNIDIVGSGTITVTGNPGSNTLTISDSNTVWSRVSINTALAVNGGYICVAPGGALLMLLPATAPIGGIIEVTLAGATSFSITQPTGVSIHYGPLTTTAGVTGNLTSLEQGCSLRLLCITANTTWQVIGGSVGNFAVN